MRQFFSSSLIPAGKNCLQQEIWWVLDSCLSCSWRGCQYFQTAAKHFSNSSPCPAVNFTTAIQNPLLLLFWIPPFLFFLLGMARTLAARLPCRYTTQQALLTKPLLSFLHLTTWKLLHFVFSNKAHGITYKTKTEGCLLKICSKNLASALSTK